MKKPEPKVRGLQPELPHARSITAGDMVRAYAFGGDPRMRRRIEHFGRINRETLKGLGARIVRRTRRVSFIQRQTERVQ